ncbi:general stress protein [Alkalihalobacillus sp. AL-G]|uniref:general stress protein n=1 Tax=Alkalihalobacillus sp. AL-G TaxID=2926399 RepID=UPI00272AAC6C|nr:general stress protein [Alkalihalobacillus sp. AL-G]WLD93810.1 general stress protein [Alkalihalobacillus sp. AL-G]
MRERLEKRLTYLYTGEFASVIIFSFVSFKINQEYPNLQLYSLYSYWGSFILLQFLLLQGAFYWYVKRRRLKKEGTSVTPITQVRLLYHLRKFNLIVILLVPMFFVIDAIRITEIPTMGFLLAMFIYLFSIAEYINYFYLQLSYGYSSDFKNLIKTRKLKTAILRKDFNRLG